MINMQTQNMNPVGPFSKTKKQSSFKTSKYLNLPDLQFFNWCNQQYQVNRGVYNTIDQWFYEYGIVNIHYRRIQLLAFLEFVKGERIEQDKQKFIRSGHGGLTKRLNEFLNDGRQRRNVIQLKK
jgi:riboflavin kinase